VIVADESGVEKTWIILFRQGVMTIASWWCGKLGVLVDWQRAHFTVVC
jgi:hypothetical protein